MHKSFRTAFDQLSGQIKATYPDAKRPEVERVRTIHANEWADVMVGCLIDEGFPSIEASPDGGITWDDIPAAQGEAFDIARYVCTAKYPGDPSDQRPLTEAQLNKLYDYFVGDLTACVHRLGYTTSTPPSRQEFREKYAVTSWSPFFDATEQTTSYEEFLQLSEACPEIPDLAEK